MVQAADFGKLHDPPSGGEIDRPDVRRILVEREMSAGPVVVGEVRGQDASQVTARRERRHGRGTRAGSTR